MTEPTSAGVNVAASITGGLAAFLGPVLGPWAAVLVCAMIGSLWGVGVAETGFTLRASLVALRLILTSCALTGGVAFVISSFVSVPMDYLLALTAFAIAAWFDQLKDSILSFVRAKIGGAAQ